MGNQSSVNFPHKEGKLTSLNLSERFINIQDYDNTKRNKGLDKFLKSFEDVKVPDFNLVWNIVVIPLTEKQMCGIFLAKKGYNIEELEKLKDFFNKNIMYMKGASKIDDKNKLCIKYLLEIFPHILEDNENIFVLNFSI